MVSQTRKPSKSLIYFIILLLVLYLFLFFTGDKSKNLTPKLGIDLQGGTRVILTARTIGGSNPSRSDLDTARKIINTRVNGLGVSGSEVAIDGNNIVITVPGNDGEQAKNLGQTAKMFLRPVISQANASVDYSNVDKKNKFINTSAENQGKLIAVQKKLRQNADLKQLAKIFNNYKCPKIDILQGNDDPNLPLIACNADKSVKYVLEPAIIDGQEIESAAAANSAQDGNYVSLKFKKKGANIWADYTTKHNQMTNDPKAVAFILDTEVLSAPVIQGAIIGGSTQITSRGDNAFTRAQTTNLANSLKYGSLPLSFSISDAQTISSTLGKAALKVGLLAGIVGFILVIIYALIYYRILGLMIAVSLLLSAVVIYPLLVLLGRLIGFTLDLPGIAGFIIGVGTTADSFVVYFERIKDEFRHGRSFRSAVERGWEKASRTILSGNAVSFLAAAILYVLAIGAVKGFAFTLGMTTVLDILIVFLVTYPLVRLAAKTKFFQNSTHNGLSSVTNTKIKNKSFLEKLHVGTGYINIINNGRKLIVAAALVILMFAISIGVRGFSFGIEFKGGSQIIFPVKSAVNTRDVVKTFSKAIDKEPVTVQNVGSGATRTVQIRSDNLTQEQEKKIQTAIFNKFKPENNYGKPDIKTISFSQVSSTWGKEITKQVFYGLIVFIFAVLIYITIRFERDMAIAALITMFINLLITAGIYSLVGFEVTPATVIGLLTILGYSLYDTVVVFDKVQENTAGILKSKNFTYAEQANLAVNQTLIRSINTALISVIPILSLMLITVWQMGVGVLKDLGLVLLVGVVVGAYASIFIASPLLVRFKELQDVYKRHSNKVIKRRNEINVKESV